MFPPFSEARHFVDRIVAVDAAVTFTLPVWQAAER